MPSLCIYKYIQQTVCNSLTSSEGCTKCSPIIDKTLITLRLKNTCFLALVTATYIKFRSSTGMSFKNPIIN